MGIFVLLVALLVVGIIVLALVSGQPDWYANLHHLVMDSIILNNDRTYKINTAKAAQNLPQILRLLEDVQNGKYPNGPQHQESKQALSVAIRTLSNPRSDQEIMISQTFYFISVWGNYR